MRIFIDMLTSWITQQPWNGNKYSLQQTYGEISIADHELGMMRYEPTGDALLIVYGPREAVSSIRVFAEKVLTEA